MFFYISLTNLCIYKTHLKNKQLGDGIPAELFQILRDDAVKVLHSICQQIWKTQQWPQDWKRSVFTPIPKKGNAKECSNYHTIVLISNASKVMLKILQVKLQQYMYWELPEVQPGLRKYRGTRDQISNIHLIIERQENYRKTSSTSAPPMTLKPLTVWITTNCGKFLKRWEYQTTYLPPQKSLCKSRSNIEQDMEQWTGSKLGKEYIKAVYCYPAYLNYMQSTSCEMPFGWSTNWNQDCREKYQ